MVSAIIGGDSDLAIWTGAAGVDFVAYGTQVMSIAGLAQGESTAKQWLAVNRYGSSMSAEYNGVIARAQPSSETECVVTGVLQAGWLNPGDGDTTRSFSVNVEVGNSLALSVVCVDGGIAYYWRDGEDLLNDTDSYYVDNDVLFYTFEMSASLNDHVHVTIDYEGDTNADFTDDFLGDSIDFELSIEVHDP
jgi:hypothetical protein